MIIITAPSVPAIAPIAPAERPVEGLCEVLVIGEEVDVSEFEIPDVIVKIEDEVVEGEVSGWVIVETASVASLMVKTLTNLVLY